MNKLEKCIKAFNLMYTDTCEKDILTRSDFDIYKIEVDYSDCISLYDLIILYNKLYLSFKKEYQELEKINIGKEIDILSFNKYAGVDGNSYRVLNIFINNPTVVNDTYTHLYIREINGVSMPFVTNDRGSFLDDKGYYRKNIKLDSTRVKEYLDLFDKYSLLFELYNYLHNRVVFGDGTFVLATKIDSKHGMFLDDMESFRVSLDLNQMMNLGDHINIKVNLGYGLNIDLKNSKVNLDGKDVIINDKMCLEILRKIYINVKYLEKQDSKNTEGCKIKLLTNNL